MKSRTSILIIMQVRDLLDLEWLKSRRKTLFKSVFAMLGIVVFTAIVALVFSLFYTLTGILITENILTFMLTILFLLSLVSCTGGLNKSLYHSSDNILLLSFPTRPNQVYMSKLIVYYLYELRRNLRFFLSFFVGYGIFVNAGVVYYIAMLFIYLFTILLPVLIGALLSIPLMLLKHLIDRFHLVKVGIYFLAIMGVYFLGFYASRYLPTEFRLVAEWGPIYRQIIAITDLVANQSLFIRNIIDVVFLKNGWQNIAIILALTVSLAILAYFISRPLYFRLASRPLEIRAKTIKKPYVNHMNKSVFRGFLKKEALVLWRTPEKFVSEYMFLLLSPLIIFYFIKLISAMPLAGLGVAMQKSFAIFLLIVILVASNTISAISISSEGKAFYFAKTLPISTTKQVWAKMTINMAMNILAIFSCSWMLYYHEAVQLWESGYIFLILCLIGVGHIFWSVEIDIKNPKVQQYATNDQNIDTSNGNRAILVGLLTGLLFTIGILKNLTENMRLTWIKILLLAAGFFIARLVMLLNVEKVLYEEIE